MLSWHQGYGEYGNMFLLGTCIKIRVYYRV